MKSAHIFRVAMAAIAVLGVVIPFFVLTLRLAVGPFADAGWLERFGMTGFYAGYLAAGIAGFVCVLCRVAFGPLAARDDGAAGIVTTL
jgi:uncharacterized membrane protein